MNLSHCAELTRTTHRNRYLCALFAPAEMREAWFAIFAFEHEIASIADKVNEEMVGFVRYAWWRETLDKVFAGTPLRGHPVAEALTALVSTHNLRRAPFDAIIDAHEKALAEKQPVDEGFLASTTGAALELCALVTYTNNVIPAKAGVPASSSVSVDTEIPAFAGMTMQPARALGIAFAAIETACLPHTTEEHKRHFMDVALAQLAMAKPITGVFAPFGYVVEFYLRRMKKGNFVPSRFLLTLTLWWYG